MPTPALPTRLHSPHNPLPRIEQAADVLVDAVVDTLNAHVPPPLRTPFARRVGRLLWRTLIALYFAFALLILVLRYALMPEIANYRGDIERALSEALQHPVQIHELSAHWVGLRPAATLRGLDIADASGRVLLRLERIEAQLAWDSLLFGTLRLAHLEINAPELSLRRTAEGRLFVAGIDITPSGTSEPAMLRWLFAQHRIVIRDARLSWQDELRGAPLLSVSGVNLQWENSGRTHRFGLFSDGIGEGARRLDLRGEFVGRDVTRMSDWSGSLYLDLVGADMALWQRWVDYPVELTQGQGSLRLWLEIAERQVRALTMDPQLANVHIRLRKDLPMLALTALTGRLRSERQGNALSISSEKLQLRSRAGSELPPTDMNLRIETTKAGEQRVSAAINTLDLAAISALAAHLPLPAGIVEQLSRYAPQGKLSELHLDWVTPPSQDASGNGLRQWSVRGKFSGLGLHAQGDLPGMHGFSGEIQGDQSAGRLSLSSTRADLELPAIFPEPRVVFDKLDALIDWAGEAGQTSVQVRQLRFENRDAAGTLSGHWRSDPASAAGRIDLSAQLSRADGTAAWRYLPKTVGADATRWLRGAITAGSGSDVKLILRGKLDDFPFRDPHQGLFEVRGQIHDARLVFAESWPAIEAIEGELLFRGAGMLISAHSASTLGAQLHEVKAEIADLDAPHSLLTVTGKASGPTSEFLRYVEASPVGEMLDHFTRPIVANGNGALDLSLHLPLDNLERSRVDGRYTLDANTVQLAADIPLLGAASGQIAFTGAGLSANNLRATVLGGPASGSIKTDNGTIVVNAAGEATVAGLRRFAPLQGLGLLDHLAGASKWTAGIRIGARNVDMLLASNLVGLSSSLPAPFNKNATEALPLRFERKTLGSAVTEPKRPAGGRSAAPERPAAKVTFGGTAPAAAGGEESLELSLGKQVHMQLLRPVLPGARPITRGIVTVGRGSPRLPERDLLFAVDLPALDLDFWRRNLPQSDDATAAASATTAAPPASPLSLPALSFAIHTDSLRLAEREFAEVSISGRRAAAAVGAGSIRAEVRSSAFAADLEYKEAAGGRLSGNIPQLTIPESISDLHLANSIDAPTREIIRRLPDIDLTIERLGYKQQALGKLNVQAANKAGLWDAKLTLNNPDASLDGTAQWRPDELNAQTRVDVALDVKNLDLLLERLSLPGTMRRGSARFSGQLAWQGAPVSIDYPTLDGRFRFSASDGQFNKLEPGVGRLLGILSLQSLPRRVTLDFRDVFSQGFAFDKIAGSFVVKHGIMDTDDLEVRGPAAKVLMRGTIDLANETQDLTVRVQPALGESLAVGAMLANPVAGAVAWAAQKLLSDPLDQAFSFDYRVSGPWVDPQVDKLGSKVPSPAAAKPPTGVPQNKPGIGAPP